MVIKMDSIIEYVSHLTIPVYIEITEKGSRKGVTMKVVKNPTPQAYSQDGFENIRTGYISQGWVVAQSARESSVYILELSPGCRNEKKMINDNTAENPKGYLYVGMTGLGVEERLNNHLGGVKSCSLVRKYFQARFGSMSGMFHYEAEFVENHLPDVLRKMGFWVYQR